MQDGNAYFINASNWCEKLSVIDAEQAIAVIVPTIQSTLKDYDLKNKISKY